jgi:5-hydroxyisourate hydrolase
MPRISTHVLDVAKGRPAAGIGVVLRRGGIPVAATRTNEDGRTDQPLLTADELDTGGYELIFYVGGYFVAQGAEAFFETITISFVVTDAGGNYHVPLLLSPFGYSTYRGS